MNNETPRNGHITPAEPVRGMLSCLSCSAIAYGSDKYCACCGGSLVHVCEHCKARVLQPVAYYCTQCGKAL